MQRWYCWCLLPLLWKACELPEITGALDGVSVTLMEDGVDGGGGGAPVPTPTPAQPRVHAPAVTRARNRSASGRAGSRIRVLEIVRPTCRKGRMPLCVEANNQRKPLRHSSRREQTECPNKMRAISEWSCMPGPACQSGKALVWIWGAQEKIAPGTGGVENASKPLPSARARGKNKRG